MDEQPSWIVFIRDNGGTEFYRYIVYIDINKVVPSREGLSRLLLNDNPDDPEFGVSRLSECSSVELNDDSLGEFISWDKLPEHIRRHIVKRVEI